MGCNCGGRSVGRASGNTLGYNVLRPDGSVSPTFLTLLEARAEVRELGGGTIRRVAAEP